MAALPMSANESAVRAAVERLSRVQPGAYHVVSCYLKLEPRDKTRGKYLIKIKNRIRAALATLGRQDLERALRAQVTADLRSEEHTSELQSRLHLVCRLLLEKKKKLALPASNDRCARLRPSRQSAPRLAR